MIVKKNIKETYYIIIIVCPHTYRERGREGGEGERERERERRER